MFLQNRRQVLSLSAQTVVRERGSGMLLHIGRRNLDRRWQTSFSTETKDRLLRALAIILRLHRDDKRLHSFMFLVNWRGTLGIRGRENALEDTVTSLQVPV